MKKFMKVGALAAVGCAVMTGCASRELTETQQIWLDDTEVLVEVENPEMTTAAKTGIPAIDAVANSITLVSSFTTGAIARYMYEQDAKTAWTAYSRWSSGDEAGALYMTAETLKDEIKALDEKIKQTSDAAERAKLVENRDAKAKAYAEANQKLEETAMAEGRFQTLPTVLKRTATADTLEANLETLIAYDEAKTVKGEAKETGARDQSKEVVDANYKPITIKRNKTTTANGITKTIYLTEAGEEVTLEDEEKALAKFEQAVGDSLKKSLLTTVVGGGGVKVKVPTDIKYVSVKDGTKGKGALKVDLLTCRPMAAREDVQTDLAVTLVKNYEKSRPLQVALNKAESEADREAIQKRLEAADRQAEEKFLALMAVEEIDWDAALKLLSAQAAQATADMKMLTDAVKKNQSVITKLAFGTPAAEGISAKESLEALKRIQAQAVLNVKLLPRLINILSEDSNEE